MRKDIDQMTLTEQGYSESVDSLNNVAYFNYNYNKRSHELDIVFKETKQKQLDAMMTKKTYEHMLTRMKKDNITNQLRANNYEI